jgi:Uncharacterized protein conserved in bacteria
MVERKSKVVQIAEVANRLVDPILARRAGISTTLLAAWGEIAGARFAEISRPERIRWPRSAADEEPGGGFTPGQLTIACDGPGAVFLMHEERELIARVNGFFGFPAIDRVRFVQKPVSSGPARPKPRPLDAVEKRRLDGILAEVDDPKLRQALERLGTGVLGRRPKRG